MVGIQFYNLNICLAEFPTVKEAESFVSEFKDSPSGCFFIDVWTLDSQARNTGQESQPNKPIGV